MASAIVPSRLPSQILHFWDMRLHWSSHPIESALSHRFIVNDFGDLNAESSGALSFSWPCWETHMRVQDATSISLSMWEHVGNGWNGVVRCHMTHNKWKIGLKHWFLCFLCPIYHFFCPRSQQNSVLGVFKNVHFLANISENGWWPNFEGQFLQEKNMSRFLYLLG